MDHHLKETRGNGRRIVIGLLFFVWGLAQPAVRAAGILPPQLSRTGLRSAATCPTQNGLHEIAGENDGSESLDIPVCLSACAACGVALEAYAGTGAVIVFTGCGLGVSCAGWVIAHITSMAGAAISCATCLHCLGGAGAADEQPALCPAGCGSIDLPCVGGCLCPDGGLPDSQGLCSNDDDEECDPDTSPDGCECPFEFGCIS